MKSRIVISGHEKRVMMEEIKRQCWEYYETHQTETEAIILYCLHEEFGFGKERLKRFHEVYMDNLEQFVATKDLKNEEKDWIYTQKLLQFGVDLAEWRGDK